MPSLECVAVLPPFNASANTTTTATMHCYFGWRLTGFVPYESSLEHVVGIVGFVVFVVLMLGYVYYSAVVEQRGWFAHAKIMAFYVALAMLYPFAFLSDIAMVRGNDRHNVNFLLLIGQAFVWYLFLRRYIAVMLRIRRARDGDSDMAHTAYKSNKRHARYLMATLLAGLTAGQLAGGMVQLLSLIMVVGLAALLLSVDMYGAMPGAQGGKRFPKLWRSFMPLRLTTWGVGLYSMFVAIFGPGFIGLLKIGGEAFFVLYEHIALGVLVFCYWHSVVARHLPKTSMATGGSGSAAWALADDDADDEDTRHNGAHTSSNSSSSVEEASPPGRDAAAIGHVSDGAGADSMMTALDFSSPAATTTAPTLSSPSPVKPQQQQSGGLFSGIWGGGGGGGASRQSSK